MKLHETAERDGWVVEYDTDLDHFYWTRPQLSSTARLAKLSDEFALYMTPEGSVEGMFIEYAKNNFMEHYQQFKPIFDNLTKKLDGHIYTLSKEKLLACKSLLGSMAEKAANDSMAQVLENRIQLDRVFA